MVYGPATLSESPEHNKGEYFQGPSQLKKEKAHEITIRTAFFVPVTTMLQSSKKALL